MISVLIPCFNREVLIKEAIQSIQNQTYKDLRIIVYNDGSTDGTVREVHELMKSDNRIKLIEGITNQGIAFARNQLLEACTTEIACWQDSDDISMPERIELQLKEMELCDMVFTAWNWYNYNGEKWVTKDRPSNHLASPTMMFRVKKDLRFNEKFKISGEDWDYIKRYNPFKIIEINKELYLLRSHEDRIGVLKTKIRQQFTEVQISKMSFAEMRAKVK